MLFAPNQQLHSILARKSRYGSSSMLPDSPNEIVCHPRVQRSVSSARQDVNIEAHFNGSWVPAFAGTNGENRYQRRECAKAKQLEGIEQHLKRLNPVLRSRARDLAKRNQR